VVNGLHSGSGSLGTAIAVLGGVAVVAALVVGGRLRTSAR
jgi:hypothetical protein